MRILSLLMVLAMLLSFAACGTDPVTPDDSGAGDTTPAETKPAETTEDPLLDNLPETTFDGETVTVWIDGTAKWWGFDMESEYIEGDVIDEAVVDRNEAVTERFDITFDFNRDLSVAWRPQATFRQSILGGDEYDITEGPSINLCPLVVYGCFTDLALNEYLNFDKPWWQAYATDALKIGDRLYRASGYYDFETITRATVYFFNANMVEDYKLGNLYDLVNSGDWTYEKMYELAEIVADDVNQDGVYDENDNYGIHSRWDVMMGQESTAGYQLTKVEDDGSIVVAGLSDQLLEIHGKIYPLTNGDKLYWSGYTLGVHPSYVAAAAQDQAGQRMFCNDQILFSVSGMGWTSSEQLRDFGAYGILPSPKYLKEQENYGTCTSSFSCGIAVTTGNYDCTSIILEALQAETYKIVRPEYFDTALSYKFLNDPQSVAMLDLVFASVTCEWSYNYCDAGVGRDLMRTVIANANLSSFFAQNETAINEKLATFMEQVETIPEYIPE